MTRDAREISRAFDLIFEACNNVQEHDACDECPLRYVCLNESPVVEIGDLINASTWDDFLNYADNVTFGKEDLDAQYADLRRQFDIEERMIDDEYGG